ncbi:autophagy-related protein 13-domain-containing protein [Gaertneriomyces semiglobifer]|nr:autophagy-related protein 13-domain-containing protein [Gaertneriomyces semiglobifer]
MTVAASIAADWTYALQYPAQRSWSYGTHSSFSGRNTGHDNRAEQMVQNVYAKFAQIVIQARIDGQPVRKPNKWFNLDMYDIEGLRDDLRHWRVRSTTSAPEPLFIDIYLDVSHMAPGQTLLLRDEYTQRRVKISNEQLWMRDPRSGAAVRVKTILLESWQLTLASSGSFQPTVDVPLSYKRAMALFRSLYSSSRLLPAYRLFRKLKKQQAGQNVSMGYRFGATRSYPLDEAGLDQLHVGGDMRNRISEHNFGSLATSYGMFNLHVNYRLDCDFAAEDTQTLVGGRLDEADENYFLPRSLDRVREGLLGRRRSSVDRPYVPEPHRRSSSSLSRPSYNAEDVARTSSGSLPRRVTRYGSHTSVHSQEGTAAPRAHAPVNIPAASLPTRMAAVHRQSYSTASTSSSPGTYYQQEVTPSPVSKRSSQGYPGIDRRQSWGVSPSSHVGFTPPSAGLALRRGTGSTGLSGVPKEFEGTPPFSVEHVEASEPPITMPSDDLAPFTSSSPPFPAPVANVSTNTILSTDLIHNVVKLNVCLRYM